MDLLNFLLYWASRVYEWFGELWDRGRQAALYAFSWATQQAGQALSAAVRYVDDKTGGVLSTVYAWIQDKYQTSVASIYALRDYLLSRINDVYNTVSGWVDSTRSYAAAIVLNVQNLAAQWVLDLQNLAAKWVLDVREFAAAIVKYVQDFAAAQVNNLNRDLATIKALVQGVNGAGVPVLGSFLSNPFGFILAYVFNAFQDLLCFGLAYGLGTTKYDLPDLPNWQGGGITGAYIPPSGGQAPTGRLSSPLQNVYVSGYQFSSTHPGVDLGLQTGDPVYAMHSGRVLYADFSNAGYGLTVVLSGGQWWTRYAHLETLGVNVGDTVRIGQLIATGDSTGNSTGPHLHLEVKRNGEFIDPLTVL